MCIREWIVDKDDSKCPLCSRTIASETVTLGTFSVDSHVRMLPRNVFYYGGTYVWHVAASDWFELLWTWIPANSVIFVYKFFISASFQLKIKCCIENSKILRVRIRVSIVWYKLSLGKTWMIDIDQWYMTSMICTFLSECNLNPGLPHPCFLKLESWHWLYFISYLIHFSYCNSILGFTIISILRLYSIFYPSSQVVGFIFIINSSSKYSDYIQLSL